MLVLEHPWMIQAADTLRVCRMAVVNQRYVQQGTKGSFLRTAVKR